MKTKFAAIVGAAALTVLAATSAAPASAAPAPNTDYEIRSLDGGVTTGSFRVVGSTIEVSLKVRNRDWMTTRVENNVAGQQAQRYNTPTDETTAFRIGTVQPGWNAARVTDSNGTVRADFVAWRA